MNGQTPANTQIHLQARSGPTPTPSAQWSSWHTLKHTADLDHPARYWQFRIELHTDDPLQTPTLNSFTIEAQPQVANDWTKRLTIIKQHNEKIVRSSIAFQYEPFDRPELKTLRDKYKLDDVVKGASTELELIERLAAWSATRWRGIGHLGQSYPAWNALDILKTDDDGKPVGGFCQQYNLVFMQACESFGLPARPVSIGPGNKTDAFRSGHEVAEIWSNQFDKWIYIDGNFGYYAVDAKTNVPLSLLELHDRQLAMLADKPYPPVRFVHLLKEGDRWESLRDFPPFVELRLIPRSNFLEQKAPLPLHQGMRGWFWTGHDVWTDHRAPAPPLQPSHPQACQLAVDTQSGALHLAGHRYARHAARASHHPNAQLQNVPRAHRRSRGASGGIRFHMDAARRRQPLGSIPRNTAGREGVGSSITVRYQQDEK